MDRVRHRSNGARTSMEEKKRTVLITGCSEGGIGANLALEFQRRGFHVFVTARNTKKIPAAIAALPNLTTITLDVTSGDSINAALKTVGESTKGRLDVLVNNSGVAITAPALDIDIDAARSMFDVNVFGMLSMCQAFAPLLVKGTNPTIVNNSSIAGDASPPFQGVYGASKAATTRLSETMRLELEPLGIKVVTLITGIIETNLHANESALTLSEASFYKPIEGWLNDRIAGQDRPKGMSTEDYARAFVRCVENGSSGKVYIGPISKLIQYVQWWMPTMFWDVIMRYQGPSSEQLKMLRSRVQPAQWETRSLLMREQ